MLSNARLCSPSRNAEPLPSTEEKVFGNSNYLATPVPLQLNFKTLFIRTIYTFSATAKWELVLVTQGTVRSGSADFQKVALHPTGTTHGDYTRWHVTQPAIQSPGLGCETKGNSNMHNSNTFGEPARK